MVTLIHKKKDSSFDRCVHEDFFVRPRETFGQCSELRFNRYSHVNVRLFACCAFLDGHKHALSRRDNPFS